MKVKNATAEDIAKALAAVNEKFDNNIHAEIRSLNKAKTHWNVKLRPYRSVPNKTEKAEGYELAPGARWSASPFHERRVCSCCWHVVGMFVQELPETAICRNSRFVMDPKVWRDWKAGNAMWGVWYSTLCDCYHGDWNYERLTTTERPI